MRSTIITAIMTAVLFSGCGGGNAPAGNSSSGTKTTTSTGSGLEVKIKDKAIKLETKAAWLFSDDWTVNMPDGKAVPTANRQIVIANYDLDSTYGISSTMKKITAADQMRILIGLQDKADIKKDAPITQGDYGSKMEEFSKILNIQIFTFADGNEVKTLMSGGNSDNKGSVKITGVTGDTVTGEIDFSNTDNSIKGSFTAKIWKQAK